MPKNSTNIFSWLWFIGYLLAGLGTLNLLNTLFISQSYSFDITHRLYYGMRILQGVIPFTVEFDDKLPFVHYLFSMPILLGGRYIFSCFSALVILAASLRLNQFTYRLFSSRTIYYSYKEHYLRHGYVALIFFGLTATTPFSFTQINSLAASLLLFGLIPLLEIWLQLTTQKQFSYLPSASLFLAASLSLRPYYIFPLAIFFLVLSFFNLFSYLFPSGSSSPPILLPPSVTSHSLIRFPYQLLSCSLFPSLNYSPYSRRSRSVFWAHYPNSTFQTILTSSFCDTFPFHTSSTSSLILMRFTSLSKLISHS